MSSERKKLAQTLLAGAALLVVDIAGPHALDALAVSDRLFSGGAWGWVVAGLTVTLVCCRIAVNFIFPGYLLAALLFRLSSARRLGYDATRWLAERFRTST